MPPGYTQAAFHAVDAAEAWVKKRYCKACWVEFVSHLPGVKYCDKHRKKPRYPLQKTSALEFGARAKAFTPGREFLSEYNRIYVSFSGGEGSLAALLSLYQMELRPGLIELFYQHIDGRSIRGIPITLDHCTRIAAVLGLKITLIEKALPYFIRATSTCSTGQTLVVTGERWIDHKNRSRLFQFEPHVTDLRADKWHGTVGPRYVDLYRPILSWTEEETQEIIDVSGILDYISC